MPGSLHSVCTQHRWAWPLRVRASVCVSDFRKADNGGKDDPVPEDDGVGVDVMRNKVTRSLERSAAGAEASVDRELQAIEAALLDFGGDDEKRAFSREIAVVESRVAALRLVKGSSDQDADVDAKKLQDYKMSFQVIDDASTVSAGSPQEEQERVCKAPPCFGYQNLRTLFELKACAHLDPGLMTAKDINEYELNQTKFFRSISEMTKASKQSVNDLYTARVVRLGDEQKRKRQVEQEETKRQKRMSGAAQAPAPPKVKADDTESAFQWNADEKHRIPVVERAAFQAKSFAQLQSPCIVAEDQDHARGRCC